MASSTTFENTAGGSTKLLYNDTSANDYVVELPKETGKLTTEAMAVKLGALGKNYIINGGFDYWNYATSQTTTGYGSDDRWNNGNSGSTKTHSLVVSGDTERALFDSPYFSRTVATSVAGADNYTIKFQRIENVTKLAGKTVTLSFWAKADSIKNIAIDLYQVFGSGGTPSTPVDGIGAQLVALTSTWQKKTITVTLPSIIGKTLGTDGVHTSLTALRFWFDAGSNYNPYASNLGQQSGTFDIAEVKLEEGSVATPWTPYEGEFGGEVQACARYLPSWSGISTGSAGTTSTAVIPINFKEKSRVLPTSIFYPSGLTVGSFYITSQSASAACTAMSLSTGISSIGYHSVGISCTVSGTPFTQNTQPGLPVHLYGGGNTILFGGCEL